MRLIEPIRYIISSNYNRIWLSIFVENPNKGSPISNTYKKYYNNNLALLCYY